MASRALIALWAAAAATVAPDVSTPRTFGVRTTLTPSIDIQHTSSQTGDEDEDETVTTATLDWGPACQITLPRRSFLFV